MPVSLLLSDLLSFSLMGVAAEARIVNDDVGQQNGCLAYSTHPAFKVVDYSHQEGSIGGGQERRSGQRSVGLEQFVGACHRTPSGSLAPL